MNEKQTKRWAIYKLLTKWEHSINASGYTFFHEQLGSLIVSSMVTHTHSYWECIWVYLNDKFKFIQRHVILWAVIKSPWPFPQGLYGVVIRIRDPVNCGFEPLKGQWRPQDKIWLTQTLWNQYRRKQGKSGQLLIWSPATGQVISRRENAPRCGCLANILPGECNSSSPRQGGLNYSSGLSICATEQ